jgi:ABC-type dipeptide/oligopeptide/nickel transport system permease component
VIATAGVSLPVFFTGLLLVYIFYFKLGWSPAPLGRLDAFATRAADITGFYLIDSLIARDFETFRAALSQLILPALTLGGLLAGADRAHDARLDAGGAVVRFRAHRARQRPQRAP